MFDPYARKYPVPKSHLIEAMIENIEKLKRRRKERETNTMIENIEKIETNTERETNTMIDDYVLPELTEEEKKSIPALLNRITRLEISIKVRNTSCDHLYRRARQFASLARMREKEIAVLKKAIQGSL